MSLVRVHSPINIAAGLFCSFLHAGHSIGFEAPVDFLAGDVIAVDTRDGQPWAVRRNGAVVWTYQPPQDVVRLTGTISAEDLQALWQALGVKA